MKELTRQQAWDLGLDISMTYYLRSDGYLVTEDGEVLDEYGIIR